MTAEVTIPKDLDAERALLGALLIDSQLVDSISDLDDADFHSHCNRLILKAIRSVYARTAETDVVLVQSELTRANQLDEIGGPAALAGLMDGVPRASNIRAHALMIQDAAYRCRLAAQCDTLYQSTLNGGTSDELYRLKTELIDLPEPGRKIHVSDLSSVEPTQPRWLVRALLPEFGLVLLWAKPNAGKTFTLLRAVDELLSEPQPPHLFGVDVFPIEGNVDSVLWLATEEDAGRLADRQQMVQRGRPEVGSRRRLKHVFAPTERVDLKSMPLLLREHNPSLVVLDSLTGLRPRKMDGHPVVWDSDNDAANQICLELRDLATRHKVCFLLVHHTGKDASRGYRGPIDWLSSADVAIKLERDGDGPLKLTVEKCRDAAIVAPVYLNLDFSGGAFSVRRCSALSSANAQMVEDLLRQRGELSQARIIELAGLKETTGKAAIKAAVRDGHAMSTGKKIRGSLVYAPSGTVQTESDGKGASIA